mmetsp:Transcript_19335/g.31666  ORF Transcript_19335/g.31666 Transcript_19335/m.31666 type:complete len:222 (+) Transcript_19335:190-855(+)
MQQSGDPPQDLYPPFRETVGIQKESVHTELAYSSLESDKKAWSKGNRFSSLYVLDGRPSFIERKSEVPSHDLPLHVRCAYYDTRKDDISPKPHPVFRSSCPRFSQEVQHSPVGPGAFEPLSSFVVRDPRKVSSVFISQTPSRSVFIPQASGTPSLESLSSELKTTLHPLSFSFARHPRETNPSFGSAKSPLGPGEYEAESKTPKMMSKKPRRRVAGFCASP